MATKGRAATPAPLSLGQKLDMLPALASIVSAGLFAALTGVARGQGGAPTYYLHVAYALLRKSTDRLSVEQLQWISPKTNVIYDEYARSARVAPKTVDLGNGAQGHWIGDETAPNVLIWYHGGGFCLPANIGYFDFWADLVQSTKAAGKDMAVFALTYTLAPEGQYPVQLTQSVEALRYILSRPNRRPSQIMLGGDSAGGNLAVGVLSHLAHPHPAISKLELSEPLNGATVMAPWTSLAEDTEPVDVTGDIVTPHVGSIWARTYMGSAKPDFYTDASTAPSSWFATFPVRQILVLGGENEILMPFIKDFVDTVKAGFDAIELFVGKREAHVAPIYNLYIGDKAETGQGKKLKAWLRDVL